MRFKFVGLATILGIAALLWPVFRSDFTSTQLFLSVIFSYLGIKLFIYNVNNKKPM